MAFYNFPPNPSVNDTYLVGTRTYIWTGFAWQIQTNITSNNPLTAATLVANTSTNSTSTTTGALQVTGGAGIGGDMYVGGTIYSGGQEVLTNASITGAVVSITAGTGTAVSTSTGIVTVWSTASLQLVTDRGNTTSNSVRITNATASTGTDTGALIVAGGVGIAGDVVIGGGIAIGDSFTDSYTAPVITVGVPVNLDAFPANMYRTAKYVVQIVDEGYTPNLLHSAELLVTHDNNGVSTLGYIVQYGIVTNFNELGTWDSIYTGGNIVLQFTPNYSPANMLIRMVRTVLTKQR